MDFTRRQKQRVKRNPEFENLEILYPHNVLLYCLPPIDEIKIREFEDLALERLKVLRIFEQANSKNLTAYSDEYRDEIIAELNREGLKGYVRLLRAGNLNATGQTKELYLQARRRDYISHFILRLAYCRSVELKRWFIQREMELFRLKFRQLTSNEIRNFLEVNKMDYVPLTEEQKNEVEDGLRKSTRGQNVININTLDFYKVHFTEVFDLVKYRRCYLKEGYAYITTNNFITIVAAKHQNEIEYGLEAARKILPQMEKDDRLFYLLKSLHTSYTGKDYTLSKSAGVPLESIDQLSKKSFPLCMRMCHEHLRTTHHHKHGGRMQYCLFLKAIGITLEDALKFWRDEFTKKIDLERFEKQYAYNIRHNYGKEGSMVNYTPYSCMKIISSSVGPSESHGCPFKHYEPSTLKLKLGNYGLSATHVQNVMNYVQKGHYQIACSKYFEITHEIKLEQGINHPNQYYELSQTVMSNREPKRITNNLNNDDKRKLRYQKSSDLLNNTKDDDELWNVAEVQEALHNQTKREIDEWGNDDFDITHLETM